MTEKDPMLAKYVKDISNKIRMKLDDPGSYTKGKDKVELRKPNIKKE